MKNEPSARDDIAFDDDVNSSEKPPSRAQRLAAQTREIPAGNLGAAPANAARKRAPRAGSRAREMNQRIRDLVRQQENELYSAPQPNAENSSQTRDFAQESALSNSRFSVENNSSDAPFANSFDTEFSGKELQAEFSNSQITNSSKTNSQNAENFIMNSENSDASAQSSKADALISSTRKAAKTSSWEEIADEIVAPQIGRNRATFGGLATGTMRGAAPKNSDNAPISPKWFSAPDAPRAILCPHFAPDISLHEALCGEEKFDEHYGAHYLVSRDAAAIDASFADLRARLERVLESEKFSALSGARVEDLLFVDIETTGLSSSQPLFLVGALSLQNEARLDLFLARDLPEEGALLAAFGKLAQDKTLITFNGKSFDWPYIEGRSRAHRLPHVSPRAHFDLLHHARRHWKHSLPNCKLQTLELYLCGRTRVDDVAGREIPRTYHEFAARHARNGSGAHLMSPILHHNALDILTMAELLCVTSEKS